MQLSRREIQPTELGNLTPENFLKFYATIKTTKEHCIFQKGYSVLFQCNLDQR